MKTFYSKAVLLFLLVAAVQFAVLVIRTRDTAADRGLPTIGPPDYALTIYDESGVLPGPPKTTRFTTNSLGLRGRDPDPSDTFRLAVVGNSTTACFFLDDEDAWPQRLEERLNQRSGGYWIANLGLRGATTRHFTLMCERVLPAIEGIDAALIAPSPAELRFFNFLPGRRSGYGDPEWANDPAALRKIESEVFWGVEFGQERTVAGAARTLFEKWNGEAVPATSRDASPANRRPIAGARNLNAVWMRQDKRRIAGRIKEPAPDIKPVLAEVRANLARAIAGCKSARIEPILVTSPALWHDSINPEEDAKLHWGENRDWTAKDALWYPVDVLLKQLDAYNGLIRDLASENDILCIDLASKVEPSAENFYDDVHFTETGAQRVADVLADELFQHLESQKQSNRNTEVSP